MARFHPPTLHFAFCFILIALTTNPSLLLASEDDDEFSDSNLFHQDYSPPAPPPPPPHPPSVSCTDDLGGVGSLDTTCQIVSDLNLTRDVYIAGKGNFYILPGVRFYCDTPGCSIIVNVTGNFSLGNSSSVFAGAFEVVAHNASFLNGSVVNTTALAGIPPPQTSGTPQGIDGAGGGHGGRGACCLVDHSKLPEDVWGGDAYSWSSLQRPCSFGSRGGSTSKEVDYGVHLTIFDFCFLKISIWARGSLSSSSSATHGVRKQPPPPHVKSIRRTEKPQSMNLKDNYRIELRAAIRQLTDRCLYAASKWAGEQLVGIEHDPAKFTPANTRFQRGSSSIRRRFRSSEVISTPIAGVSYVSTPIMEEDEIVDGDFYLLAKSYFDCREYRRAAHALRDQGGKKSVFLRCYALYLAGEKRKEEELMELEGPLGKSDIVNRELVSIERELSTFRKNGTIDPFGLYLYGLVLKEKGNGNLARTVLVESVNSYPWNWNAWLELQSLCTTVDILNSLSLNNHWMKEFFLANVYQELRMHKESLSKYDYLHGIFGFSNYIQAQIAKVQYSLREFDLVEGIFEDLLRNDPYRVEDMDMYSNVLYAKECSSALSYLAHRVFMTDKYRPESCCIIGNYYSLKGLHEKAVLYFRRALKLDRNYLSAWTLMGHEFIEMKNTPAAVDAYRHAIDINPSDYRAWYGLGQAYEMMGMPFYALHYFRKSVFFQPNDSRLWIAMAHCYQTDQLNMIDEAMKCYKRAANCNDRESIALNQLAKLNADLGRTEEAVYYYKKDLERMEDEEREGPNMVETLFFLAKYFREQKKFEEAEVYCTRLMDYTGPEKERAKSLLRGIRMEQTGAPSMDIERFPP